MRTTAQGLQARKSVAGTFDGLMLPLRPSGYSKEGLNIWKIHLFVVSFIAALYMGEGLAILTKTVKTYCQFPIEWCDINSWLPTNVGSAFPRLIPDTVLSVEPPVTYGLSGSVRITPLTGTLMAIGRMPGAVLGTA